MKTRAEFRQPTSTEVELIRKLVEADFPGQREIARQLESCRVRTIDDEGSLEFELSKDDNSAIARMPTPDELEIIVLG